VDTIVGPRLPPAVDSDSLTILILRRLNADKRISARIENRQSFEGARESAQGQTNAEKGADARRAEAGYYKLRERIGRR